VIATSACGGKQAEAPPAFDTSRPHWEDAFDRTPDILVVAHPKAMGKDPTYGPLLKSLSRMIAARAPRATGTRAAEVFESCEEIVLGLRERGTDDAIVVVRGVRADFDASKLVDDAGEVMWSPAGRPTGGVQELVREKEASPTSLFVLAERTWVFALGAARERAREAFAHPFNRPTPVKDDLALILVRLDGPSLVQAVPRLRSRRGALAPLGQHLSSLALALRPGKEGLVATFAYDEEGASAVSELLLKQTVEALGREGTDGLKWLGQAAVSRQESTVAVRVSLPPRLVEDLPTVSAGELGL
jgi:hypothetical protein